MGSPSGALPRPWRQPESPCPPSAAKVDLRKTLFLLPNIITLSSIFCGFDSIRLSASATRGRRLLPRVAPHRLRALLRHARRARRAAHEDAERVRAPDRLARRRHLLRRRPGDARLQVVALPARRAWARRLVPLLRRGRGPAGAVQRALDGRGGQADQAREVHRRAAGAGRGRHPDLARHRQPRRSRGRSPGRGTCG